MKTKESFLQSLIDKRRNEIKINEENILKNQIKTTTTKTKKQLNKYCKTNEYKNLLEEHLGISFKEDFLLKKYQLQNINQFLFL